MTVPAGERPEAVLRPTGPQHVYDLMLADIEADVFDRNADLPQTSALAERYGAELDDVVGARYLLAADNHVRLISQNNTRLRWGVGPSEPEDPQHEIVRVIRAIRADKARESDDPSRLDVYLAAPSRTELAARYAAREHSVRVASELEFPGLPHGSPEVDLDAFANFVVPTTPRELQPALVRHLQRVIETRAARERLPSPKALAVELGVDQQQITRAYATLTTTGWCVGIGSGTGTFVAHRGPVQNLTERDYTRHELRKLIGRDLEAGEFSDGILPPPATLRTRWKDRGRVFAAKQVARTLEELLAEGSVRREGIGKDATWFINAIPALSPPDKPRRQSAPAYVVWDIADELERRINDGEYRTGYRLPTDHELAEEFDVSPSATQEAMRVLALEGIVATVMSSGTWNRLAAKPGRYVAPSGGAGHGAHLAAAPVVERIEHELSAGRFVGLEEEVECDRDSVWPSAKWFAKNYGVREEVIHTALLVHARRGTGANLRRDPKYSIPLAAFDPGPDGPPPIKNREWAAKGGREGWVVERISDALRRHPEKGLRLPREADLVRQLRTSHTTVRLAIKRMPDRLTTRRNQGGGVFTTVGEPTETVTRVRRYSTEFRLDLASPPSPGSRPEDIERMGRAVPIGWEGTLPSWKMRLARQVSEASKQALLVATAENALTADVVRDNAMLVREGIRQAVLDARTGAERPTHTRAQFRNEARQLLAILEGVAPHLEFSSDLVQSWTGSGGIPYVFNTRPPLPPVQERQFLTNIYTEVEAAFAGPLQFEETSAATTPPAGASARPRRRAPGGTPTARPSRHRSR